MAEVPKASTWWQSNLSHGVAIYGQGAHGAGHGFISDISLGDAAIPDLDRLLGGMHHGEGARQGIYIGNEQIEGIGAEVDDGCSHGRAIWSC
jgi:hypothetical protein